MVLFWPLPAAAQAVRHFEVEPALAFDATRSYPGDVDDDGDVDLVSTTLDGALRWHPNDGAGNFGAAVILPFDAYGMVLLPPLDLDADGDVELLLGADDDGLYAVDAVGASRVVLSGWVVALAQADLDGDGDLDLALSVDDQLRWSENLGGGVFAATTVVDLVDRIAAPAAGDIDGDGRVDLVSASIADGWIRWYPNRGPSGFGAAVDVVQAVHPGAVHLADLDGDGAPDLVTSDDATGAVWTLRNAGGGAFEPPVAVPLPLPEVYAVDDLDADGDVDLLAGSVHL
ncbi:MAG: VCBS repeat-containing protein, partial [Myxococcota bacterium]